MGKFLSISLVILSILLIQVFADEATTEVKTSPKYTPLAGRVKEYEFYESFDEGWEKRWIHSKGEKYNGKWQVEQGHEPEGLTGDKGLTIPEGALHYGISTKFSKPIDNKDKDLVIQYEVRLQNGLDCGGAYMKLFPEGFEPESLLDNSRYVIMFGPDKCGSDNKVHFIFQHQNPISKEFEEKHMTTRPKIAQDKLSHLYTLHVSKDNTFVIYLDQEPIRNGSLLVDFAPPVNPSKEIDDPSDVKPADWVDEKTIPDPDAVKPEGWDDEPELIADPDATMPSDWNEEEDGVWEAPLIENPEYKGEWTAKMIENPEYKGEWKAKQIPNPNYFVDENPHNFDKLGGLGFELWTMSKDIQFDNILIAHNKEIADKLAEITWKPKFAEQRRIQKELDAKAHDAGDSFDWNKLINDITDFTSKNPIIVAVSVALGIIVPTVLCFLLPSGKPTTKNAVTSNSTEEKVEEEKEEKEEVEVKETSKETSKTVNRRKPPRDNNE